MENIYNFKEFNLEDIRPLRWMKDVYCPGVSEGNVGKKIGRSDIISEREKTREFANVQVCKHVCMRERYYPNTLNNTNLSSLHFTHQRLTQLPSMNTRPHGFCPNEPQPPTPLCDEIQIKISIF